MSEQASLFNVKSDHEIAFDKFNEENPEVYRILVKYAREARAAGRQVIGMRMLLERFRWYSLVETNDPEYKINNNHCGFYARKIMSENPDLDGLFNLREMKW